MPGYSFPEERIDNSVEAETPMTIRQLMNHTSGLTYGAFDPGPVGQLMRSGKIDFGNLQANLGDTVRRLASIPFVFNLEVSGVTVSQRTY